MTFRTRRWPVALAVLMFVAACGGTTGPTTAPTTGAPQASTPAPETGSPAPGESTPAPAESTPPASETATPGGGPVENGSLIFAEWQPVSQLNPFFTTAFTSFESLAPALRGGLTINEDGQWTPDLLTDVPSVENGALVPATDPPADCTTADAPTGTCFTLTLTLKPGYSWSNGSPVTLNDFKATYDKAAEWGAAGVGCAGCATFVPLLDSSIEDTTALYDVTNRYISDIEVAADGMSMTVTWQKNYAGWLGWAASGFLQADWVSGIAADAATSAIPVGPGVESVPWNGPYKIVAASVDGIDYEPNEGWGGDAPKLASLHEKFYAAKDGMITDFLAGNIDLAFDMTQADFAAVNAVSPDIGRAELDSAWQYEHFDLQNAHANVGLDDVKVRTAIAMAVNKQDLVDVLFPGSGVSPACSVAPPGTPWRDDSIQCAAFDPDGAKAMLDEAGWVVNEDTGKREKDVDGDGTNEQLRLKLCTTAGNPTRLTELSKLNQYLTAIGIPSDVQTADAGSVVFAGWADTTPDTQCSIYRGTYDIADYAYILGGDIYSNYYYTYHSSQIPSDDNPNGSNDTRLANDDMDAALTALGYEIDPSKQNELASTVQQVIATQNNEIPIYYRAETTGVSVHVGGWNKYNPSSAGPTWHVEDWFQAQ